MPPQAWQKNILSGLGFALAMTACGPAGASDALTRFLTRAGHYTTDIDEAALRQACADDVSCAARRIAGALGPAARLENVEHPTSDVIRWADTEASMGEVKALTDGRRLIVLNRFGRKTEQELSAALEGAVDIVLDLRGNSGGDFGRMMRVAGLLIGPRADALVLRGVERRETHDLPSVEHAVRPHHISVLVGPATASSAEVLAALLRAHGRAEILGSRTAGKDYLLRVVPVDHDWRLLIPAERIEVPGEVLIGGLAPDRALPAALLAMLAP